MGFQDVVPAKILSLDNQCLECAQQLVEVVASMPKLNVGTAQPVRTWLTVRYAHTARIYDAGSTDSSIKLHTWYGHR